ncbi:MAG: sigma-54-dependent Fis family transcriptional regulator [Phycisphaerales bacterium]|nr:MAG: sigma-54-dependent Fis family transcriptional regulator [Phycisphaerales bacterium]
MDRLRDMQLSLWREACRHIDVADSISDLAGAVGAFIPLEAMWVFALGEGRCSLVASWGAGPAAHHRFSIDGEDAASVERFVRKGGISLLNAARPGRSLLTPIAPAIGDARVVCGALSRDNQPEGVVVWRLGADAELDEAASGLLAGALEPLAVALDTSRRFHELESLRRAAEADRQTALRRLGRETLTEPIIGAGQGLRSVMERVDIVARSDVPALILGETGSGKEVVARAIHERSARHDGPFLRVNCGAMPADLIDSQLFGHERGAFTGATEQRQGWFERADTGTLFLDEIGELPLAAQVRLLRVIQEGSLERVGGQSTVRIDCRIIAATHRDLAGMVREGAFREDLWYRLAVFPLVLPSLRERREDLRELAQHFANRAAVRFGLPEFEIDDAGVALLGAYDWPGNVRELAAVIDRAALLGGGRRLAIGAAMGAPSRTTTRATSAPNAENADPPPTLDAAIRAHIEGTLRTTRGKIEGPGGAAEMLGVNPHTLRSKMRKLGISWGDFRPASAT